MKMPAIRFHHPWGELLLRRHPHHRHPNLQAWDGADRYLLEHVHHKALSESSGALVLNDAWGALACSLAQAGIPVTSVGDSFISWQSLQANAQANGLQPEWSWATDDALPMASLILVRLPKELSLLEYQLVALSRAGLAGQRLWLGGMDKHLPRNLLDLLSQYLEKPQALYGKYKARLFEGRLKPDLALPPWQPVEGMPGGLQLDNGPGVFGRRHLDIGARFLIEHLPDNVGDQVADLGCGNGALGLAVLARTPSTAVTFIDESAWAVASARHNCQRLFPGARALFHLGNGLEGLPTSFDTILLNPPFHRGFELETTTAQQLFRQSALALAKGGQLLVVANRHLAYLPLLRRVFEGVEMLASSSKFVVWQCRNALR